MSRQKISTDMFVMLGVTILLVALFFSLHNARKLHFEEVEHAYNDKVSLCLNGEADSAHIAAVLFAREYLRDSADVQQISGFLARKLKDGKPESLYDLQKRRWQMSVEMADSLHVFQTRVSDENIRLGVSMLREDSMPTMYAHQQNGGMIRVRVQELDSTEKKSPSVDTWVSLTEYWMDSTGYACDTLLAYGKTDTKGIVVFEGLNPEHSYSVRPIKRYRDYGPEIGTRKGSLAKYKLGGIFSRKANSTEFTFVGKEHRIPVLSSATLAQIKRDDSLTIRTPKQYTQTLLMYFLLVVLAWWGLYLWLNMRGKGLDTRLLAVLMLLSTTCVLMMFSIQNPLMDGLNGAIMGQGVLVGIVIIALAQRVDFVRFYQGRTRWGFDWMYDSLDTAIAWLCMPFRRRVGGLTPVLRDEKAGALKKVGAVVLLLLALPTMLLDWLQLPRLESRMEQWRERYRQIHPKGLEYLLLALLLTALMWSPLGSMVGGMRVNLNLFGIKFQPSEIAKYLILFFMSAYFCGCADTVIAYSAAGKGDMVVKKFKTLAWLFGGLILLMLMYLGLGDMGPGLVLGVTFVLVYSLIKSKGELTGSETHRIKAALTCDFALLLYGVISFAAMIWLGARYLDNKLLFAGLWLVLWIGVGLARHRQFYESAVMLNMVLFMFIFGGDVLKYTPLTETAERFEQRMTMSTNTWGDLEANDPVSNTQVAEGLWGLATGGSVGQGLGKGHPNLIPAFHTDMILESIGEQMGWLGLLIVVLAIALLLRRTILIGYRSAHPFALYLCIGIAIVTAVQFFIISLGSTGVMPLTGITVPMLSFGRVSMILNLAAFGVVLSLSKEQEASPVMRASVAGYNYPISMMTWTYVLLMIFVLGVFAKYQLVGKYRNRTLIQPVYVFNKYGRPTVQYNPRIELVKKQLKSGNIYDRNGLLLATSDVDELSKEAIAEAGWTDKTWKEYVATPKERYYPYGMHTYFMLGDANSQVHFYTNDAFRAESRYDYELKGYDDRMYTDETRTQRKYFHLSSDKYQPSNYLAERQHVEMPRVKVKDYTDLLPMLKSEKAIKKHNDQKHQHDLYLTIDAALQTKMQQVMQDELAKMLRSGNRGLTEDELRYVRASIVMLDAHSGDLLASSVFPLPDEKLIREMGNYYSDNHHADDKTWTAFSDQDLGLCYQTYPGSTAKVISAMAGMQKLGVSAASQEYYVSSKDAIEYSRRGGIIEPTGNVDMRSAIVKSSNCYFIHLVNDQDLYEHLETIYEAAGLAISDAVPYKMEYEENQALQQKVAENRAIALQAYQNYLYKRDNNLYKDKDIKRLNKGEWKWAWGQGYAHYELHASPLNMALVAATVANGGVMPVARFTRNDSTYGVPLIRAEEAAILRDYMHAEATSNDHHKPLSGNIGGKTGTPERTLIKSSKPMTCNDGWYMFYVETSKGTIAAAVRLERLPLGQGSGRAVQVVEQVALHSLEACGYQLK